MPPKTSLQLFLLTNVGRTLASQGDIDGSEQCYSAAIGAEPNNGVTHFQMGEFLLKYRNDTRRAIVCFMKAVELEPTRWKFIDELLLCLHEVESYDEMLCIVNEAIILVRKHAKTVAKTPLLVNFCERRLRAVSTKRDFSGVTDNELQEFLNLLRDVPYLQGFQVAASFIACRNHHLGTNGDPHAQQWAMGIVDDALSIPREEAICAFVYVCTALEPDEASVKRGFELIADSKVESCRSKLQGLRGAMLTSFGRFAEAQYVFEQTATYSGMAGGLCNHFTAGRFEELISIATPFIDNPPAPKKNEKSVDVSFGDILRHDSDARLVLRRNLDRVIVNAERFFAMQSAPHRRTRQAEACMQRDAITMRHSRIEAATIRVIEFLQQPHGIPAAVRRMYHILRFAADDAKSTGTADRDDVRGIVRAHASYFADLLAACPTPPRELMEGFRSYATLPPNAHQNVECQLSTEPTAIMRIAASLLRLAPGEAAARASIANDALCALDELERLMVRGTRAVLWKAKKTAKKNGGDGFPTKQTTHSPKVPISASQIDTIKGVLDDKSLAPAAQQIINDFIDSWASKLQCRVNGAELVFIVTTGRPHHLHLEAIVPQLLNLSNHRATEESDGFEVQIERHGEQCRVSIDELLIQTAQAIERGHRQHCSGLKSFPLKIVRVAKSTPLATTITEVRPCPRLLLRMWAANIQHQHELRFRFVAEHGFHAHRQEYRFDEAVVCKSSSGSGSDSSGVGCLMKLLELRI